LDREIEISVPSPSARLDILHKLLARTPHEVTEEELKNVAYSAHGFVGADLASLCSRAAVHAFKRTSAGGSLCGIDSVAVKVEDLLWAMTQVKPSAMREVLIEVPNVCEIHGRMSRKCIHYIFVFVSNVFSYGLLTFLASFSMTVVKFSSKILNTCRMRKYPLSLLSFLYLHVCLSST
jgi:hypothetical protein